MDLTSVTKHNGFIDAKYETPHLSKAHGRIIAFLVSKLHSREDRAFQYVEITPQEYRELTGNTHYKLSQVEFDLRELTSMVCRIEDKKAVHFCHLVDYAKVEKKTGLVTMRLGEEMKPFLLELQNNYTMYYLEEFLSLKSKHAQRLYELHQKHKNIKNTHQVKVSYELEDFKKMLGLVEYKNKGEEIITSYPRWDNFEKRVLKTSREELLEKVGIYFDYIPVKGRRGKVVSLDLYFHIEGDIKKDQYFTDNWNMLNTLGVGVGVIPTIHKLDICMACPRAEIKAAVLEDLEEDKGKWKNLLDLVPKTRKERHDKMVKTAKYEGARIQRKMKKDAAKYPDLFKDS